MIETGCPSDIALVFLTLPDDGQNGLLNMQKTGSTISASNPSFHSENITYSPDLLLL
jgi:hypothetical protein